jgi:hypothetical protein
LLIKKKFVGLFISALCWLHMATQQLERISQPLDFDVSINKIKPSRSDKKKSITVFFVRVPPTFFF